MRSLNIDSDDYGELICRAFDFGGPLNADALISEDGTPVRIINFTLYLIFFILVNKAVTLRLS